MYPFEKAKSVAFPKMLVHLSWFCDRESLAPMAKPAIRSFGYSSFEPICLLRKCLPTRLKKSEANVSISALSPLPFWLK